MSFERLQARIRKLKNPVAVRLSGLLPDGTAWKSAADLAQSHAALLEALCDIAPAFVFAPAGYQRLGWEGMRALGDTLTLARSLGGYTVADLRVSAAGAEARAIAETWLSPDSPFEVDCLTVAPYLGSDGLAPFLAVAKAHGKEIVVVVRTASELPGELQDMVAGDRMVYTVAAALADRLGQGSVDGRGYRMPGIAVDADCPAELRELRRKFEQLFFFVPGYRGADDATDAVRHAFDRYGHGVLLDDGGALEAEGAESPEAAARVLRDAIKEVVTIV